MPSIAVVKHHEDPFAGILDTRQPFLITPIAVSDGHEATVGRIWFHKPPIRSLHSHCPKS
jgi:hypothetical protein